MRAYIVPGPQWGRGDRVYDLIAEDGEHIASHICSSPVFAPGDLWEHRHQRQEAFAAKGITEVVWITDAEITLEELLGRNKAWSDSQTTAPQSPPKEGSS